VIAVSPEASYSPAGFFVLRSATLPIERLEEGAGPAGSPATTRLSTAIAVDGADAALQSWGRDPLAQAAVYLASPTLSAQLSAWIEQPSPKVYEEIRPALFRYFLRMTGRATPFGLFASTSVGEIGAGRFELAGRRGLLRRTWLDLGFVYPLVARTVELPEVRRALSYTPNSTLSRVGDDWRYLEEIDEPKRRRRTLVRLKSSEALDLVLAEAGSGIRFSALTDLLVQRIAEVVREEAEAFVDQLIDSQVLVPSLVPSLTGPDPVERLLERAAPLPELAGFHAGLGAVADRLTQIDRQDGAQLAAAYRSTAPALITMLEGAEERHLFHVDLRREAPGLQFPASLLFSILKAVQALRRMTPRKSPQTVLDRFRQRFISRYGDREVDLMSALDEDIGIGFDIDPGSRRSEGLLADFRFPAAADSATTTRLDARLRHLIVLLERAWREHRQEIVLSEADLKELAGEDPAPLPDVFTVFGYVMAPDPAAPSASAMRFALLSVSEGAGLFGRFCRADPILREKVRDLLAREEALRPDADFAEVVYLPDDRAGNVVCRPALRAREIAFLGVSGLAPADQIGLSDLTVSVAGGRIVLRSRSTRREVLPRLTCAHNFAGNHASVYRFLASLAKQDVAGALAFSWGACADALFLPRVVYGEVVLSAASWRVDKSTATAWRALDGDQRRRQIAAWRDCEGVPRWVQVGQFDHLLTLDLDNALCIDVLIEELARGAARRVTELTPPPHRYCVRSPEGRHASEVMIPWIRDPAPPAPNAATLPPLDRGRRRFTPGTEWLYAKLYGSLNATEDALKTGVRELVADCRAAGLIDSWHFVRYRDEDDHLRVRVHGAASTLRDQVVPRFEALFERLTRSDAIWRSQFDTYEREATRYGGEEAIELAERIFDVDSDFVLSLLVAAPAAPDTGWRWQLGLRVVDLYYEALGFNLEQREAISKATERSFGREFRVESEFEAQLSRRFRAERSRLMSMFDAPERWAPELRWTLPAVDTLRARLAAMSAQLTELARDDRLATSLESICGSLTHMHLNRMMLANPREHELIVHAFLHRIHRSLRAQAI
jgi:thiopeptide-type bacteriocin biosynthesis protein